MLGGYERNLRHGRSTACPTTSTRRLLPEDWDRFAPLMANACSRVPAVETVEDRQLVNGPEGFTPDNEFILGESERPGSVRGGRVLRPRDRRRGRCRPSDGRVDSGRASPDSTCGAWTSAASVLSTAAATWPSPAPSRCTRPITTSTIPSEERQAGRPCGAPRPTSALSHWAAHSARRASGSVRTGLQPNAPGRGGGRGPASTPWLGG